MTRRELQELLFRWNWCMTGNVSMTEYQRHLCLQIATAIDNRLRRAGKRKGRDWYELSSGERWKP